MTQEQQALQASLLALRQLLGGSRGWRTRLARLAAAGARRTIRAMPEPRQSPCPGIGAWAGPAIEKYGSRAQQLLGTAHRQAVAETALELLGPDGAAETEASQEFLLTRCLSIAGGTTQILLTQVAERVLGLPR